MTSNPSEKSRPWKKAPCFVLGIPLALWAIVPVFDLDDRLYRMIGASQQWKWTVRLAFTLLDVALVVAIIWTVTVFIKKKPWNWGKGFEKGSQALIALMLISALIAIPQYQASAAPGGAATTSKEFKIAVMPNQEIVFPSDFPAELVETMRWAILHAPMNTPIVVTSDEAMKEHPSEVNQYAKASGAALVYTPEIIRGFPTSGMLSGTAAPDWIAEGLIIIVIIVVIYVVYKAIANAFKNAKSTIDAYTNRMNVDVVSHFGKSGPTRPRGLGLIYPVIATNYNTFPNWRGTTTMISHDLVNWSPLANITTGRLGVLTNDTGQMVFVSDVYVTDMNNQVTTNQAMSPLLNPGMPIVLGLKDPIELPCPQWDPAFFEILSN